MEYVVIWIGCAIACYFVAKSKGRNAGDWAVAGFFSALLPCLSSRSCRRGRCSNTRTMRNRAPTEFHSSTTINRGLDRRRRTRPSRTRGSRCHKLVRPRHQMSFHYPFTLSIGHWLRRVGRAATINKHRSATRVLNSLGSALCIVLGRC